MDIDVCIAIDHRFYKLCNGSTTSRVDNIAFGQRGPNPKLTLKPARDFSCKKGYDRSIHTSRGTVDVRSSQPENVHSFSDSEPEVDFVEILINFERCSSFGVCINWFRYFLRATELCDKI